MRLCVAVGATVLAATSLSGQQVKQPSRLDVHVVAHGAKLIGSAVGGARVTIRDASSGEVLASGVHEGGTGDTDLIMRGGGPAQSLFTTPGAAVFTTTLALDGPRRVTIEASGPLSYPEALANASTTLILAPGVPVTGDGVVLELHGYIVELLDTPTRVAEGGALPVRARVRMLCSCPTEPGGLWEAGTVIAMLVAGDGTVVERRTLEYEGADSTYGAEVRAGEAGSYTLRVVAAAEDGNAGSAQVAVTVGSSRPDR